MRYSGCAFGLHVGFGFREPLDTEGERTMRTSSDACSLCLFVSNVKIHTANQIPRIQCAGDSCFQNVETMGIHVDELPSCQKINKKELVNVTFPADSWVKQS